MRGIATMLVLLAGCDRVFGLESRDAGPDAATGSCPALRYDPGRYHKLADPGLTWTDARARCTRRGMDLAVLDDGDGEELAQQSTGGTLPFWLGVAYGESWSAIDDCTPSLTWATGEPVTSEPGYCVLMTTQGMVVERCSATTWQGMPIHALCETPRPSDACTTLLANSQYTIVSSTVITHVDAEARCAQVGMQLLELSSSEELAHIRQTVAPGIPRFWLAAEYELERWSSATMCPQLFFWRDDEPDLSSDLQIYAAYDGGGRTAYRTNGMAAAICESNLPP